MTTDYYLLLGVSPSATGDEIRRAYAPLAQAAQNDNDRPRFEALHEAFETLKDADRRAEYDTRRMQEAALPTGNNATMAMQATGMPTNDPNQTAFLGNNPAPGATMLSGATVAMEIAACPVCQTKALPDEGFCITCGFLLGSPVGEQIAQLPLPTLRDANGRIFILNRGVNIVGRDGADVMLPDQSVSRRHATIQVEAGNIVALEDTGSTNGTKRGGQPVLAGKAISLADGDTIQFGSVRLTITIPNAPDARLALPAGSKENTPVGMLPSKTAGALAVTPNLVGRLIGKDGNTHSLGNLTTFGRKTGNDVVINGDAFVSGSHAKIERSGADFILTDLESTNGTRLNGRKLSANVRETVNDGDIVTMGNTEFTFRRGA